MRRRRAGWWACTAWVGGLFAIGSAVLANDEPQGPAQQTMTIRGQEHPVWPVDDLRRLGFEMRDIPREDNAFYTYLEALNSFKDLPTELDSAFEYALATGWPAGQGEALKAFLLDEANQKAIALARQAATSDSFQIAYFGDPNGSVISLLLPSLSHCRQLSKLMVADGLRLEEEGAYLPALENYAAAMRMGHQLGEGITLIETLVGVAVWSLGDRSICRLVRERDLTADQLEVVRNTVDELADLYPSATHGIENERRFGTTMVDEIVARPFSIFESINGVAGGGGNPTSRPDRTGWAQLEWRLGRLLLPDRTVKSQMNTYYDLLADRAARPAYEARLNDQSEEDALRDIPQWNVLARMFLPSLSRAMVMCERVRMQSLMTRLTVALRLYAAENEGRAPARLAALAGDLPADDLIDPFSGHEFVYRPDGDAWLLYSFSDNLQDDGGKTGDKPFEPDYVVQYPPPEPVAFEPATEGSSAN